MVEELALFEVCGYARFLVERVCLHFVDIGHHFQRLEAGVPVALADGGAFARRKPRLIHQQQRAAASGPSATRCKPVPLPVHQARPERLIRRAVHGYIQAEVDPHRCYGVEHLEVHIGKLLHIDLERWEIVHRIARFRKHRGCAVRVVGYDPVVGVFGQRTGVEVHIFGEAVAEQHLFHYQIAVYRHRERMPHQPRRFHARRIVGIADPRMLVVGLESGPRRYRLAVASLVVAFGILEHPEVAAVGDCLRCAALVVAVGFHSGFQQIGQEAERHGVYDVNGVRLDERHAGGVFGYLFDADAVKRRRRVPVVHKGAAYELVVSGPAFHLKRPGADGVLERPIAPHIVDGLLAVHEDKPDYRALILRSETPERELDGVGVHDHMRILVFVQIADIAEHRLFVLNAGVAEAPLDVGGGHFAPIVVELNALPQVDGYLGQIRRHIIRFCEVGIEQQVLRLALGEAFHKPDESGDGVPRAAGRLAWQSLRVAERSHSHFERAAA